MRPALPPKADVVLTCAYVGFVPGAEVDLVQFNSVSGVRKAAAAYTGTSAAGLGLCGSGQPSTGVVVSMAPAAS